MAENIPTSPGGALPPKPAEASKVQPKKETVRINLPPKPTSAPTIKLPTLAPGAPPPGAATSAAPVAASAAAASKAPPPPLPTPTGSTTRVSAPAKPATAAPATAPAPPRPMAMPAGYGLTGLDKGLAVAAAVFGLAALGVVLYLAFFLKDTVPG
ncbi:MAG: hypothetical protein ABSH38_00080 [Verrucomicrobiota bacterium]